MSEPFVAEIKLVSFTFAPKGWAFCNGQLLPINQNQALFSLLGTTYGGDGVVNFALPDLRGRTPIHVGAGHTLGERSGEVAHTLSTAEMPQHTHVLTATNDLAPVGNTTPGGRILARGGSGFYGDIPPAAAMDPASVTSVGGSQAHENMMPFLVLNFIIALQGIFPSRN